MTFLNFSALFGLAAIGIPIAIHLLNKVSKKEVTWAAMRFLLESVKKSHRRLMLEDILLLLMRCLLVALLIFTLARPTFQANANMTGSKQALAVIILDDSYSMGLTNGIDTSFKRAKTAASQILETFPSGSSCAFFLAADNVDPVIPELTPDFGVIRQDIQKSQLTDRGTDLTHAIQLAVSTLQKKKVEGSKEIYLITDGQAIGLPALEVLERQLADIRKEIVVHLILVGDSAESNAAVTGLNIESGLAPINVPLRCSVDVLNSSETEARDIRVSLLVDDQLPIDETTIDQLAPGATRNVSLFAQLRTEGFHTITAQIPHDRLAADDQRTVAVRAIRGVKVLLVQGSHAEKASNADDFFVRNALVPVAADELAKYYVNTTTINAAQLSGASLSDYDAVFLLGVDQLDPSQCPNLFNYVEQGGGLVVFPSAVANLDFYNHDLGKDGFLPATLLGRKGDPKQDKVYFMLQANNYDHPVSRLWNDPSVGTLATAHFFAYYPLVANPDKSASNDASKVLAGASHVILHFANSEDPLAIEHTWGNGRVILFASTATKTWNDLPIHAAFVPLMSRVLGSLVSRRDEGLNIRVGQNFSFVVNDDLIGREISVQGPDKNQHDAGPGKMAAQVVGQVTSLNGHGTIQFSETDKAGSYQVSLDSTPPTQICFAVQSDPAESNLSPISQDALDSLSKVVDVIKWNPNISLTPKLTSARVGTEFWIPILSAALILATLETFVAQAFSRSLLS